MALANFQPFPVGSFDPTKSQTKSERSPDARIAAYLRRLAQDEFYGTVTIQFRAGRIEVVRTEQSLKLVDVPAAPAPGVAAIALGTTTAAEVIDGNR